MGNPLQEWQREARRLDCACKGLMDQNKLQRAVILHYEAAINKAIRERKEGENADHVLAGLKDALKHRPRKTSDL